MSQERPSEDALSRVTRRDIPANNDGRPGAIEMSTAFNIKYFDLIEYLVAFSRTDARSVQRDKIASLKAENLRPAKDTELLHWLMTSDKLKWKRNPTFFHALVQELKDRGLVDRFQL